MAAAEQLQKMDDLIAALGKETKFPVPGLDKDKIIEEIAKNNEQLSGYSEELDRQKETGEKTPEEAEEEKKKILDDFKKTLEPSVNEQVAVIQNNYTLIQKSTKQLTENVASAIASTAIPPAIGAPPVAPNPAYAVVENKQKKNLLLSILSTMKKAFLDLIAAARKIAFPLPDSVLTLGESIGKLESVVATIP
jgi:hypothetical protein